MPAAPPSLSVIADRVQSRLMGVLDPEQARWSALDADLAVPFEAMRTLALGGGKRLRPAFCHWGYVAAGGDPAGHWPVDAGAALELLHAFALFHDDVMDGSATRRGVPTAHVTASQDHHGNAWSGEARRFGEGVAILVGDLAFVYADQLLRAAHPRAWDVWNELRIELNVGQYLDILGTARRSRERERAQRICRYKSGKYTVERPLHLGAVLASSDVSAQVLETLSAYGLPLGDAFQMRDDILGVFGDEVVTGKPVGDDLREGKPTTLLAIAYERATPAQQAILECVGSPELDSGQVALVQQVLIETGALSESEDEISRLAKEATEALDAAVITSDGYRSLIELAEYVCWRDS